MSDSVIMAIIVGIPAILSALGSLWAVIIGKEIHALTNKNFSDQGSALKVANEKIIGLECLVSQMVDSNKTAASTKVISDLQTAQALSSIPPQEFAPERKIRATDLVENNKGDK